MTFIARLKTKEAELKAELTSIDAYIESEAFHIVDAAHQALIRAQRAAMTLYHNVLVERLHIVGEDAEHFVSVNPAVPSNTITSSGIVETSDGATIKAEPTVATPAANDLESK